MFNSACYHYPSPCKIYLHVLLELIKCSFIGEQTTVLPRNQKFMQTKSSVNLQA